jgi:hypothetical protein
VPALAGVERHLGDDDVRGGSLTSGSRHSGCAFFVGMFPDTATNLTMPCRDPVRRRSSNRCKPTLLQVAFVQKVHHSLLAGGVYVITDFRPRTNGAL